MKFIKSELTAPRDARVLIHAGEGLEKYRFWTGRCEEKHKLADELNWWASALPEQHVPGFSFSSLMFPEVNRSEKATVHQVLGEIAKTLRQPNKTLSIATHSTAVAKLIVSTLVQLGLQQTVQVFWHDNRRISRGWVVDQDTMLATDAFDLEPSVDENFTRNLDFGTALTAVQS